MMRAGRLGILTIAAFAVTVTFIQGLTNELLLILGLTLCAVVLAVMVRSAVKR